MNDVEKKVSEWCLSKVGEGYIYGARGQICSKEFRIQQATQYPSQAEMIMNTGAKWDGIPVWDCAQLTRYAAKQGGVELVSGATSQWNKTNWKEKGTIDGLPVDKVCFLYRYSSGAMQHTGIYVCDGCFVHAKGTAYGVLHQKLNAYKWTHYAIPYWGEEKEKEEEKEMDVIRKATVIPSTLNVRREPDTSSARIGVLYHGDVVEIVEESPEWCGILYNDGKAYVMRKFLSESEESEEEKSDTKAVLEELKQKIDALIDYEISKLG